MNTNEILNALNAPLKTDRTAAMRDVAEMIKRGEIEKTPSEGYVNNHIHTTYSFSPYSPTAAVFCAWKAGLDTAGIMDHDSVAGAREFLEAAEIIGMPVTVGVECRVRVDGTPLYGRRINNPDQISAAYLAIHGIPHQNIEKADEFFSPLRQKRNERNVKICKKINALTNDPDVAIDFEKDVLPLSMNHDGGSVTERHVLFALTKKITSKYQTPEEAVKYMTEKLGMEISGGIRDKILSGLETPQFYEYDILGALKGSLVEKIYIDADEECPHITEFIQLAKDLGAISAYAYLGDVGDSVTGDKKAQHFEDSYLDELMEILHKLGFNAITYMPSRNTKEQLENVINYCNKYQFFQISGEDINSPRQSFICKALSDPSYQHLKISTYALIGHEFAATQNIENGMFTEKTISEIPSLDERISKYCETK